MAGSLRRVPTPLAIVLLACLVEALAWCIVLPPLQGPDEASHIAYVQRIAEAREIPWSPRGAPADPGLPYSTELAGAAMVGGFAPLYANRSARPAGTAADERLWAARAAELGRAERADGGYTPALKNPPAYYLYGAAAYAISGPLDIFDQLLILRLANIPFLLITVLFAWLIAGELLGRRRWLQTLVAGAVAVQPQLVHLTAVVNPDVCLAAIWTVALYVIVVVLKRGLTVPRAGALAALCAVSGFTHGRGLALLVPALLAVALALYRARHAGALPGRRLALTVGAVACAAGAALFVAAALGGVPTTSGVRQLGSYLWQFYLPRPSFLNQIGPDYGFREVVVERYYGAFAQLEVAFSARVYDLLWLGLVAIAASALVALVRWRAVLRERWDVAVVLGAAAVALLGLLHVVGYRSLTGGSGDPIITGRYLLPLVSLYGMAIALAVAWLPRRRAVAAGGVLLALLTLVQLGAMAITVERFYA